MINIIRKVQRIHDQCYMESPKDS